MQHLSQETLDAYTGHRPDVESLILGHPARILDVGCATGTLGASLKRAGAHVTGIELNPEFVARARERLDVCIHDDAGHAIKELVSKGEKFDLVVFADILEHLVSPDEVLKDARQLVTDDGQCIVSLPNVRFHSTFTSLLFRGRWPRLEYGVHDKTHLRWFTSRDAEEMFRQAGFEPDKRIAHYRLLYRPHRFTRLLKFMAIPPIRPFITYQYVWRLRPRMSGATSGG